VLPRVTRHPAVLRVYGSARAGRRLGIADAVRRAFSLDEPPAEAATPDWSVDAGCGRAGQAPAGRCVRSWCFALPGAPVPGVPPSGGWQLGMPAPTGAAFASLRAGVC